MKPRPRFSRNVLALLISTQFPGVYAQVLTAPAVAPTEAQSGEQRQPSAEPAHLETVVIHGNSIGMRQVRANVKITAADLDYYPPGVSADKVLERVSGIQQGSSNAFGGDGFESTINMRGFAKDSIGFSVDGIPNGRTTLGGGSVPTRYFDASNLAGVDVSQSAGVVGSPSHQSLVGHVNYLTQDPEKRFGMRAEAAAGTAGFGRLYGRVDTGEIAPGITSYLSLSKQTSRITYVDDPAGVNGRDHVDLKVKAQLDNGVVLKLRTGYNNRTEESGTNIVTLAKFNANPKADGYTDRWTGTPAIDRNYRGFKGNPRKDQLTDAQATLPLGANLKLEGKLYHHTQTGIGKEAALGNAGFPGLDGLATSLYFRANQYEMTRRGALAELAAKQSDLIDWRVGAWVERYDRSQLRNWFEVVDESVGMAHQSAPATASEDKRWVNRIKTIHAANRSSLLDHRLKLDYGVSFIRNQVDYVAPIQDSKTAKFNFVNQASVSSGPLPKLGAVYSLGDNTEVFAGLARNAASITDATLEGGAAKTQATATTGTKMDTANALDVGLRHKGSNYAAGVQAFFIKSEETVAADIVGTLQSENVNQGRQIGGVEMTYSAKLGDWRLYSALTLQSHKYVLGDVDARGYPAKGFIRDGADLVGIANQNLFLEATWRPTEDLKLAMNARHISSRAGYYANPRVANSGVDERLPASTLLGFNASYSFEKATVGLNIENLTNTRFISGIAPELMTSPSTVGRYFIGSPRSVMIWLKMDI